MLPRERRSFLSFCAACVSYVLFIWLCNYFFIWNLAHHHVRVRGLLYPTSVIPGNFILQAPSVEWKGKLSFNSNGHIRVSCKGLGFFSDPKTIEITSSGLDVRVDKSIGQNTESISIRHVRLIAELRRGEEPLIHHFELDSPQIGFQLEAKAPAS